MKATLILLFSFACATASADALDDLTPPQAPPIIPPPPPAACGKVLGPPAVSNLIGILVGPMLSRQIAREVRVTRNGDGTADVEIAGQFTEGQAMKIWSEIRSRWSMPKNTSGKAPQSITLTPTNGGAYVRIDMAQ